MSDLRTGHGPRSFPPTDWAHLIRLQDPDHPDLGRTLDSLARRYWSPVYHYVRARTRTDAETAKDRTQQFFAQLLDRGSLGRLSQERGSFRGFLKTAVRNFLVSAHRAQQAREPRGEARLVPIEAGSPEASPGRVADDTPGPVAAFVASDPRDGAHSESPPGGREFPSGNRTPSEGAIPWLLFPSNSSPRTGLPSPLRPARTSPWRSDPRVLRSPSRRE